MLFGDVGPALVGQADRQAISGMNSVEQAAISKSKIFVAQSQTAQQNAGPSCST